jgi:hypothetical protein
MKSLPHTRKKRSNPQAEVEHLRISLKVIKLRHRKTAIDRDRRYYERKLRRDLEEAAMSAVMSALKGRL